MVGVGLLIVGVASTLMLVGVGGSMVAPGVTAIAKALSQLVDSIKGLMLMAKTAT